MENPQSFQFFNRGPSPVVRLVFFSLLSLLLLFVDARYKYLETARSAISILVYPLQRMVTTPGMLWRQADAYFTTQNTLLRDNQLLHQQHSMDAARLQQLLVLRAENLHLRELLSVQQHADYPMQMAEIVDLHYGCKHCLMFICFQ